MYMLKIEHNGDELIIEKGSYNVVECACRSLNVRICKVVNSDETEITLAVDADAKRNGLPYNRIASLFMGDDIYGDAVVLSAFDTVKQAKAAYNDICEFADSLEEV